MPRKRIKRTLPCCYTSSFDRNEARRNSQSQVEQCRFRSRSDSFADYQKRGTSLCSSCWNGPRSTQIPTCQPAYKFPCIPRSSFSIQTYRHSFCLGNRSEQSRYFKLPLSRPSAQSCLLLSHESIYKTN